MNIITITEEPMNESEIAYLQRMEAEQAPLLRRTIRLFIIIGLIIACVVGVVMLLFQLFLKRVPQPGDEPPPNILLVCMVGIIGLAIIVGFATYLSYARTLLPIRKDIARKYKIVEKSEIVRKRYMKENNSFHFYISSPTRLSIEVEAADFTAYDIGDEINIEYTRNAKIYLGYY